MTKWRWFVMALKSSDSLTDGNVQVLLDSRISFKVIPFESPFPQCHIAHYLLPLVVFSPGGQQTWIFCWRFEKVKGEILRQLSSNHPLGHPCGENASASISILRLTKITELGINIHSHTFFCIHIASLNFSCSSGWIRSSWAANLETLRRLRCLWQISMTPWIKLIM